MTCSILNVPSGRLLAICQRLSRPPHAVVDILCKVLMDPPVIALEHRAWGLLVTFTVSTLQTSRSLVEPQFPEYPDDSETKEYRIALLMELLPARPDIYPLAASSIPKDGLLERRLADELFRLRSEHRASAINWWLDGLRIYGIRMWDQPPKEIPQNAFWTRWRKKIGLTEAPKTTFDFIVRGSPAEFAAMARMTLQKGEGVHCVVTNPDTRRKLRDIPQGVNPVEVVSPDLSLVAFRLVDGGTLLKVAVSDNKRGWGLWDALRDEMGRLGWFSVWDFQNPALSFTSELSEVVLSKPFLSKTGVEHRSLTLDSRKDNSAVWEEIPNRGWDRECVRLWHRGLTCKDIGLRLQRTEKTILNRLNQLRKEYGEQIVPYRNANYRSG